MFYVKFEIVVKKLFKLFVVFDDLFGKFLFVGDKFNGGIYYKIVFVVLIGIWFFNGYGE